MNTCVRCEQLQKALSRAYDELRPKRDVLEVTPEATLETWTKDAVLRSQRRDALIADIAALLKFDDA